MKLFGLIFLFFIIRTSYAFVCPPCHLVLVKDPECCASGYMRQKSGLCNHCKMECAKLQYGECTIRGGCSKGLQCLRTCDKDHAIDDKICWTARGVCVKKTLIQAFKFFLTKAKVRFVVDSEWSQDLHPIKRC